jgi:effector-binding domain-containing protein
VLSNALTFTVNSVTAINPVQAVDYGIIYYPNPASGFLIIDSLKLSDKWETLKIISIDGKHQHMSINIRNQRKIRVDVAHLADGLYAAILYRNQKDAVYLKFIKLQ